MNDIEKGTKKGKKDLTLTKRRGDRFDHDHLKFTINCKIMNLKSKHRRAYQRKGGWTVSRRTSEDLVSVYENEWQRTERNWAVL